jgi:predicted dehydrogenase
MDKVRLGIVGCGTISQLNAPGYLADERCDVVALCDPVMERAQQRAAEWGIDPRIYTSYEQMLNDSEVDAVELLTPTFLHPQQIIDGLAAGKHVSCQKPAANTVDEIRDIAAAVSRADTFYRTTENFLYYPPIVKARDLIQDGTLGDVSLVRIRTVRGGGSESAVPVSEGAYVWRRDPDRNVGGLLYDDGWHKVATAMWWGGDVESVSAVVTRNNDDYLDETPTIATWKYVAPDRLASIEYAKASEMPLRTRYYSATSSWRSSAHGVFCG